MLQPGRLFEQHGARRVHADRLHLVDEYVVRSILQRQQLGDDTVFSVHVWFLRTQTRLGSRVCLWDMGRIC